MRLPFRIKSPDKSIYVTVQEAQVVCVYCRVTLQLKLKRDHS